MSFTNVVRRRTPVVRARQSAQAFFLGGASRLCRVDAPSRVEYFCGVPIKGHVNATRVCGVDTIYGRAYRRECIIVRSNTRQANARYRPIVQIVGHVRGPISVFLANRGAQRTRCLREKVIQVSTRVCAMLVARQRSDLRRVAWIFARNVAICPVVRERGATRCNCQVPISLLCVAVCGSLHLSCGNVSRFIFLNFNCDLVRFARLLWFRVNVIFLHPFALGGRAIGVNRPSLIGMREANSILPEVFRVNACPVGSERRIVTCNLSAHFA